MRRNQCVRTYHVNFVTPAFLGGADQSGQWRVPPFKAMLRKWWRIVWWTAQDHPSLENLRLREGWLFGTTAGDKAGAACLRLRIDTWREGLLGRSQFDTLKFGQVDHPEVKRKVSTALYLGYGPIVWDKRARRAALQRKAALGTNEQCEVKLMYPAEVSDDMEKTIRLLALFGCLGGRSRNGWGSLALHDPSHNASSVLNESVLNPKDLTARQWLQPFALPWRAALQHDWCHALGADDKGLLLWRTQHRNDWEDVLKDLAEIKIGLRTQFAFQAPGPHDNLCPRHILAYPVTNHVLAAWGSGNRCANQLFFKVHKISGGFCGLVAHLPHGLPEPLKKALKEKTLRQRLRSMEQDVWSRVHKSLDNQLVRLP